MTLLLKMERDAANAAAQVNKPTPVLVRSGYEVGDRYLDVDSLRAAAVKAQDSAVKGQGPEHTDSQAYMRALFEGQTQGKLSWSRVRNMMELRNKLAGINIAALVPDDSQPTGFRTVMTGAFPALISQLNVQVVNEAYAELPDISDQLMMDMDDPKQVSFLALILNSNVDIDSVQENGEFPEIASGEEAYEIHHRKNGRKIKFTYELFKENNIPEVLRRLNALAKIIREMIRKQSLRRFYDIAGSGTTPAQPYVLRAKGGAGASLYVNTANLPGTRAPNGTRIINNPLTGIANLEAARIRINSMRNERGEPYDTPAGQNLLVVPDAVLPTALVLTGSMMVPGNANELNNWGPQGEFRPRIVSSPVLDVLSATAWFYGDPKRQFVRKWKQRPTFVEVSDAAGGQQAYLDRDIVYQARLSYDMEVGAQDYTAVVQSLAASTAP